MSRFDEHDPLIHGPRSRPSSQEDASFGLKSGPALDLNQSNPLQDLFYLFTKPRAFFSFFYESDQFSGWVKGKAILGLIFWTALYQILNLQQNIDDIKFRLDELLAKLQSSGGDAKLALFLSRFNVESLDAAILAVMSAISHVLIVIAPVFSLLAVALLAVGVICFFKIFSRGKGLDHSRKPTFLSVFLALCYCEWYQALKLLPWGGNFLALIVGVWATILAVKCSVNTTTWRSFWSTYGIAFVATLVLLLFFGAIFSVALLVGGGAAIQN